MTDDSLLPFALPSVQRKKVSAAFDGGPISSDGGLVLLREAERSSGVAETLAGCIRDRRNRAQVVHSLPAMLRFRMFAIACGYEDADDCDALRADPLFRLEASTRGFDARYIVTSLEGEPRHLYEDIYCARCRAENLIKMHKGQLASDRTSCQSPLANRLRLVLHTAVYWLMLALRDAIPRTAPLARAEFATLRPRLLKIGARVVEKATRVRIHFTAACPDAALFRLLAGRLAAAGP